MRFASFAHLFASVAVLGGTLACSSTSPGAAPTNGVNDVLQACQARAPWTNASSTPCNSCIGYSTTPRCACTDRDYAGKCNDQEAAKNAEPTCSGVDACVGKCDRADCACVDGCYAGKPVCRSKASAVDGCVVETCSSYCR